MKNYKKIVPIGLFFLIALGTYVSISSAFEEKETVETYLKEARDYAELGIVDDALKCYDMARDVQDSVAINIEEGNLLADSGRISSAISWGEDLVEKFPKEAEAYAYLIRQYITDENYEECFSVYSRACDLKINTEAIEKEIAAVRYEFCYDYEDYEDVGDFSEGYAAVCQEGKWGYVDETGESVISCQFTEARPFVDVAAVKSGDEWYYIDSEGKKKYVVQNIENCSELGTYNNDILIAMTDSGYGYYNIEFDCMKDGFNNVTAFNGGIAFAQDDKGWYQINSSGEKVSDTYYDDVITDAKGLCYRNDRIFVKEGLYYHMIDVEGNEIAVDGNIEDARMFLESDGLAAVKVDGAWGFIDKDGNFVIEPSYREAHSFINGYAAVKVRDTWGFITKKNKLVLECQFEDVKDFSSHGTAFVKQNGEWKLLKLYKDNYV